MIGMGDYTFMNLYYRPKLGGRLAGGGRPWCSARYNSSVGVKEVGTTGVGAGRVLEQAASTRAMERMVYFIVCFGLEVK
jgi:hypothetical protein